MYVTKVYSLYKNSDYTCLLNVIIFLYFHPIIFLIRCMIVVIYSFSILRECFKFYLFIYYMSRLEFSPPSSLAIHSSSYLPFAPINPFLFCFCSERGSPPKDANKAWHIKFWIGTCRIWLGWMKESTKRDDWKWGKQGHFEVM